MPNRMLEYCKTILQKISFSKWLFKKEYKKTFKYLSEEQHVELKKWIRANSSLIGINETAKNRAALQAGVTRENKDAVHVNLKSTD